MKEIKEKHPLAIRWFHWINFPVLALMIWSGLLIYWAHDRYRIGFGGVTLFHFFPKWVYTSFHLKYRLAEGMAWHFTIAWLFAINGIIYVSYTLVSGAWRELLPARSSFRDAIFVMLHDLHLRKSPPPASGKFNAAQRIVYTAIVLMGAGSLVTGLAIYKPVQFGWLTGLLGGYPAARAEHFALTVGYVVFFFIHVAQVIRAGWNNFRAMVAGFEIVEGNAAADHD